MLFENIKERHNRWTVIKMLRYFCWLYRFSISVYYLILWCLITCPLGEKKSFFSKKKTPKHPKAPTFSWFYPFLKDSIWAQVHPYVVAASECVNFPHIYTSLHNYFIMKLCLTLTWLSKDLIADRRSFCYIWVTSVSVIQQMPLKCLKLG